MGATENLRPNLVGLSNMAIQFLPKDYKLVEVIEATREIISGVRYELLVAARDENDEDVICRLVVTEITWKLTAWGDKQRILNYSNCTSNVTTDDNVPKSNDFSFNPLFVTKTNFINDEDLKLIEAQIINPKNTEKTASKPKRKEKPDFDLSNLEAMIIPLKSSPMSVKTLTKTQSEPNTGTDINSFDTKTQVVSGSETVRDCNQPNQEVLISKSELLPETQLKIDSNQDAITEIQDVYEVVTKTLSFPILLEKQTTETEKLEFVTGVTDLVTGVTKSLQQEIILNEPKLEVITSKTEEIDTSLKPSSQSDTTSDTTEPTKRHEEQYSITEHSDIANITESTVQANILSVNEVTEIQTESNEELTTLLDVIQETSEHYLPSNEDNSEQLQPKIESVSLQMEDSVAPSQKTVMVFEKITEDNKAINQYSTENSINQENPNRAKRDVSTEMKFLESLTNEALEQLDYVDSDNFKRVVLDILRVKKMEQEYGAIYVIKVRTATSNCPEGSDDLHETCLDNVIKDTTKICFIEVKIIYL